MALSAAPGVTTEVETLKDGRQVSLGPTMMFDGVLHCGNTLRLMHQCWIHGHHNGPNLRLHPVVNHGEGSDETGLTVS